ncbi:hypothetical protein RhiirC2_762017, partial [Rhizophagus irregularis]
MFILQWIPMSISQGARLVLNEEPWVYIMGTIGKELNIICIKTLYALYVFV